MIPRNRLDIGWTDLLCGLTNCVRPSSPFIEQRLLAEAVSARDGRSTLGSLSVRSGFDAVLSSIDLAEGSEALVSAITIRDMPGILREHHFRVVPVKVDRTRLSVDPDDLARSITPRSKVIVVAHLFGARMPMDPVIAVAREHGLMVIEDCAQAFTGDRYWGHPASDVAMFSFGPVKTATALGGAVLLFRDIELRDRVAKWQSAWPIQSRTAFFGRLIRFAGLKVLASRWLFTLFVAGCRWCSTTHDRVLLRQLKGFRDGNLMERIRRAPSAPLLALVRRRLRQDHSRRIACRVGLAKRLGQAMENVERPGVAANSHSYWVYPILSDRPDELVGELWQAGYDATRAASGMAPIEADHPSSSSGETLAAEWSRLLYLPTAPDITEQEIAEIAQVIRRGGD
jgi:perosamine synthetase